MTIPFWTLLAAILLPYLWATVSSVFRARQFGSVDNRHPRLQQAQLEGSGARAHGASQNAFEALATYAPAVIVAHIAGADPAWSARLAVAWLVFRIIHGVVYVANVDKVRSLLFVLALGCSVGLFGLGAFAH